MPGDSKPLDTSRHGSILSFFRAGQIINLFYQIGERRYQIDERCAFLCVQSGGFPTRLRKNT